MNNPNIIIIGLGNPGKKYENTRHNLGFKAIDRLAKEYRFNKFTTAKFTKAYISTGQIGKNNIMLIKPMTMMNESGDAVQSIISYYRLSTNKIWVIYDDLHLFFGQIRTRNNVNSDGGHKGIRSIIDRYGHGFSRIRLGISNKYLSDTNLDKFVLDNFSNEEKKQLKILLPFIVDLVSNYINNGFIDQTLKVFKC